MEGEENALEQNDDDEGNDGENEDDEEDEEEEETKEPEKHMCARSKKRGSLLYGGKEKRG